MLPARRDWSADEAHANSTGANAPRRWGSLLDDYGDVAVGLGADARADGSAVAIERGVPVGVGRLGEVVERR